MDDYQEVERLDPDRTDHVEARANAFAIAFLAPPVAVEKIYHSGGIRAVMDHFGISYSAASNHIRNVLDRPRLGNSLTTHDVEPTDEWRAREAYTEDLFYLPETSLIRRGEFAGVVVAAERQGLISEDTACLYLQASPEDYVDHRSGIAEMFPVWVG